MPPVSVGATQESASWPEPHGVSAARTSVAVTEVGMPGALQISPVVEPHADQPALFLARTANV